MVCGMEMYQLISTFTRWWRRARDNQLTIVMLMPSLCAVQSSEILHLHATDYLAGLASPRRIPAPYFLPECRDRYGGGETVG